MASWVCENLTEVCIEEGGAGRGRERGRGRGWGCIGPPYKNFAGADKGAPCILWGLNLVNM